MYGITPPRPGVPGRWRLIFSPPLLRKPLIGPYTTAPAGSAGAPYAVLKAVWKSAGSRLLMTTYPLAGIVAPTGNVKLTPSLNRQLSSAIGALVIFLNSMYSRFGLG